MKLAVEKVCLRKHAAQLSSLVAAHDSEIARKAPGAPRTNLPQLVGLESQGLAAFFVAYNGANPVGYIYFTMYELDGDLIADNVDVYVLPDYRRSRAAHLLMASAKRWAAAAGVVKAYTSVEVGLPTGKFAQRYGFKPVQTLYELNLTG